MAQAETNKKETENKNDSELTGMTSDRSKEALPQGGRSRDGRKEEKGKTLPNRNWRIR